MKEPHTSSGAGVINNAGGDPHAYLGHFRSKKVLECGHNQGAPGGADVLQHPAMNPISNPNGFTAATGAPGSRVGGNMGVSPPKSVAGPLSPVAQPAMQKVGGNVGLMQQSPGLMQQNPTLGITGTPGAAPVKTQSPAGAGEALQGLQKLIGGRNAAGARLSRSTGAGANATKRTPTNNSSAVRTPKTTMNVAKEPGVRTPALQPANRPKAVLQSNTDVLRKARQGVRSTVRGGRKNPRM